MDGLLAGFGFFFSAGVFGERGASHFGAGDEGIDGEVGGHLLRIGLAIEVLEIVNGELEGVEDDLGAAGVEAAVEDGVGDLGESELDGFGFLEGVDVDGGIEGEADAEAKLGALLLLMVEVAEFVFAERGRAADDAVGLDVRAGADRFHSFKVSTFQSGAKRDRPPVLVISARRPIFAPYFQDIEREGAVVPCGGRVD